MSAQTRYAFSAHIGNPGGLADLAPYAIDTFHNESETGTLKFGMGVVAGTTAGSDIIVPKDESTADKFEGIATNNRTTEFDLEGNLAVRKNAAVGVLRYGRIYARVASDANPKYGEAVYLVKTGENAGCFTSTKDSNLAVNGRFLTEADNGVAVIELFNGPVSGEE